MKKSWLLLLLCLLPFVAWAEEEAKPMIALTFDDGPSAEYTQEVLDILAEYDCHATFFMVGARMKNAPEVVRAVAESGHEIGLHTWGHDDMAEMDSWLLESSLRKSQDMLQSICGVQAQFVRPPWGRMGGGGYVACRSLGLYAVTWSIDSEDWKTRDSDKICESILSQLSEGGIILCHDVVGETVKALRVFLPEILSAGYQVVTVEELFAHSTEPLRSTTVYYCLPPEKIQKDIQN